MKKERRFFTILGIVFGVIVMLFLTRNFIWRGIVTFPSLSEAGRIRLTYFVNTPVNSSAYYYNMRETDNLLEKLLTDSATGHKSLYQNKSFKEGKVEYEKVNFWYKKNGKIEKETADGSVCEIRISKTHNATLEIEDEKYIFYLQEEIVEAK